MTGPEWWWAERLSRSLLRRQSRRRVYRYAVPVISPHTDRLRERAMDGFTCHHILVTLPPREEPPVETR